MELTSTIKEIEFAGKKFSLHIMPACAGFETTCALMACISGGPAKHLTTIYDTCYSVLRYVKVYSEADKKWIGLKTKELVNQHCTFYGMWSIFTLVVLSLQHNSTDFTQDLAKWASTRQLVQKILKTSKQILKTFTDDVEPKLQACLKFLLQNDWLPCENSKNTTHSEKPVSSPKSSTIKERRKRRRTKKHSQTPQADASPQEKKLC